MAHIGIASPGPASRRHVCASGAAQPQNHRRSGWGQHAHQHHGQTVIGIDPRTGGLQVITPLRFTARLLSLTRCRYYPLFSNNTYNDRPIPLPNSQLSTSIDTVLTALAQLSSHRTKTSRALISLFDAKWQYIIAEATPDMPLGPRLPHTERNGEELWLCGTAIPRVAGICEGSLGSGILKGSASADLSSTFITDLQADDRFSGKPYCVANPSARFYAAVPIRTARGIDIGVLAVIHNEPLHGNTEWKQKLDGIMSDMSSTIMSHLESERIKLEHRRSQRMVRGVGSFVERASTLTDWHEGLDPSAFMDVAGMEGTLNVEQQALHPEQRNSSSASSNHIQRPQGSALGEDDNVVQRSVGPPGSARSTSKDGAQPPPASPLTQQGRLHDIFSRAANLIRESIEIEGVVFLDANTGSFGSRIERSGDGGSSLGLSAPTSSSDEALSSSEHGAADKCCPVLGFSNTDKSSINDDKASRAQITFPGKVLSTLLRRYPGGKIWSFDENGSVQSSDSSEEDDSTIFKPIVLGKLPTRKLDPRGAKPWARQREGSNLLAVFPGARSIAFVPAWDEKAGRWHSGCFVYTLTPARVLTTTGELSYLRAFNVMVIAEVARLQAKLELKAQNDVLNSISHELRSPLHGVILGVELLQDTALDTFQGNITHTVETCGRTLLDTIDHLLDFSNINNFLRVDKKEKHERRLAGRETIESGMKNLLVDVNLDVLVEEVVESVFAGYNFQRLSIGDLKRGDNLPNSDRANRRLDYMKSMEELGHSRKGTPLASSTHQVLIHLDIEPEIHRYLTTVGAIRRIIMNLFGNALKYTQTGAIKVSLSRVLPSTRRYKGKQQTVRITVSDTGRGMSEDYIDNKLYIPFQQENDLTPGTGLGLSLVKGIVDSLGGEISVTSQVNVGTTVSVTLPLKSSASFANDEGDDMDDCSFSEQRQQLKGLRVHLGDLAQLEADTSNQFAHGPKRSSRSSLGTVCHDWLQMEIVQGSYSCPDIVLCSESAIDTPEGLEHVSNKAPVVVLCTNPVVAHSRTLACRGYVGGRVVEFISQP